MKTNMKINEMKLGQEHKIEINKLNNTIEQINNKNDNYKKQKDNEISELNFKINELKNQIKYLEEEKKMNLKTDNFIINSEKRKVTDNKRDINNNYNNWIYRSLDIGLAANGNGDAEVVVKDCESSEQGNLVFGKTDTKEEIIERIGEEVYSWLSLMFDQLDDEDEEE